MTISGIESVSLDPERWAGPPAKRSTATQDSVSPDVRQGGPSGSVPILGSSPDLSAIGFFLPRVPLPLRRDPQAEAAGFRSASMFSPSQSSGALNKLPDDGQMVAADFSMYDFEWYDAGHCDHADGPQPGHDSDDLHHYQQLNHLFCPQLDSAAFPPPTTPTPPSTVSSYEPSSHGSTITARGGDASVATSRMESPVFTEDQRSLSSAECVSVSADPVVTPTAHGCGPSPAAADSQSGRSSNNDNDTTCLWQGCSDTNGRRRRFADSRERFEHLSLCHLRTCPAAGCPSQVSSSGAAMATKELLVAHIQERHPRDAPRYLRLLRGDEGEGEGHDEDPPVPSPFQSPTTPRQQLHQQAQQQQMRAAVASEMSASSTTPRAMVSSPRVLAPSSHMPPTPTYGELAERRAVRSHALSLAKKKRCQEALVAVLERRARKALATTASAATTGADTGPSPPSLLESASFPVIWEHGVLPFLVDLVSRWMSWYQSRSRPKPQGQYIASPFSVNDDNESPGFVISVHRPSARQPKDSRRIHVMTARPLSRARRAALACHTRDLLPGRHGEHVTFIFTTGRVERSFWHPDERSHFLGAAGDGDETRVWARGLGPGIPDAVCRARNPFCFRCPAMGDSVGCHDGDQGEDEITATLGPRILLPSTGPDGAGEAYWVVSFHPFLKPWQRSFGGTARLGDDAVPRQAVPLPVVQHPSPYDRQRCLVEAHDVLHALAPFEFTLGKLTATSGMDLRTTRVTHDPYWSLTDVTSTGGPPQCVTDWTLVTSPRSRQANFLRRFPSNSSGGLAGQPRNGSSSTAAGIQEPVTTYAADGVVPGCTVISTGRSSGHSRGVVCEIPAYVSGSADGGNGTGRATREWFVEDEFVDGDDCGGDDDVNREDEWIRGGMGIRGDSGAPVVTDPSCSDTPDAAPELVGQIWGRNAYYGPGPRVAYFTSWADVLDDVTEKCGLAERPVLPAFSPSEGDGEAEAWPAYPLCRACFDLRSGYLDSRRTSRESLRSILGQRERERELRQQELRRHDGLVGDESVADAQAAYPNLPGRSFSGAYETPALPAGAASRDRGGLPLPDIPPAFGTSEPDLSSTLEGPSELATPKDSSGVGAWALTGTGAGVGSPLSVRHIAPPSPRIIRGTAGSGRGPTSGTGGGWSEGWSFLSGGVSSSSASGSPKASGVVGGGNCEIIRSSAGGGARSRGASAAVEPTQSPTKVEPAAPTTPRIADGRSPYSLMLEIDEGPLGVDCGSGGDGTGDGGDASAGASAKRRIPGADRTTVSVDESAKRQKVL